MSYTPNELVYYSKSPSHITADLDEALKLELIKLDRTYIKYMKPYDIDFAIKCYEVDPTVFKYIDTTVLTIKFLERVVSEHPLFIEYIYEPAIWLIKIAVNKDPNALQVLPKIPEEIYAYLLKKNGLMLEHIKVANQTPALVKIAIEQNIESYIYAHIKNIEFDRYILTVDSRRVDLISELHPEFIMAIVTYNPRFITKFFDTPEIVTDEIKRAAIRKEPEIFKLLKNPDFELCKYAISIKLELFEYLPFDQKLLDYALTINGLALKYVLKKDLRTIKLAVEKNVLALKYIDNPRQFLIDYAFGVDGIAIQFIKSPTPEQYLSAIKRNGYAIEFIPINKQTKEIQMYALAGAGAFANKYITPIDSEVTLQMIRLEPGYIFKIENPTDEMFFTAFKTTGQLILYFENWETRFNIDIKEIALMQDGTILSRVQNKTKRLIMAALTSFPYALQWVTYQDLEMAKAAINYDVKSIYYVEPAIMDSELLDLVMSIDPNYFTRTEGELTFEEWIALTDNQ